MPDFVHSVLQKHIDRYTKSCLQSMTDQIPAVRPARRAERLFIRSARLQRRPAGTKNTDMRKRIFRQGQT